ncbi:FIG00759408: hypothetical protein [hydrothermal vent metagenome]|uniref:Transposase IS200-like domain-containing protein n=1 Tax=hydrothermal vent metagenome TaxID=652676 RepID=A0A3B0XYB4_9ZZZZ
MARPLRLEFAGALYHVTARGNRQEDIFEEDADRLEFISIFQTVCEQYNWVCHAYCLMGNHYHLLIETPDANLSKGMRQLNGVYTQTFNRKHNRVGHLFQGRYKSILVEKDSYLLELSRYIVLNPVRAQMVRSVVNWRWSSYRAMTGQIKKPAFLEVDWVLSAFGKRYIVLNPVRAQMVRSVVNWRWSSYRAMTGQIKKPAFLEVDWVLSAFGKRKSKAIAGYKKFVSEGKNQPSPWHALKNQIYLGGDKFVEKMQLLIDGDKALSEVPSSQRRPVAKDLVYYEASYPDRNTAIVEAYLSGGYTLKTIGEYFNLHYSTVSGILRDHKSKT